MKLYPFQFPAADTLVRALTKYTGTALTTPTGSGKTHICCNVAKRGVVPIAVVCPKAVIPAWERAAVDWGVPIVFVSNYEKIKRRTEHGRWKVKNRKWEWHLPERVLLIFDEAHRCRTRTSQNAKLLIAAKRQGISHVLVSATLAESPLQLYSIGFSLDLHALDDWFAFMVMNGCEKGAFGWEYRKGEEGMSNINARVFPSHGYTAKHADLPGFPDNFVRAVEVPVTDPALIDSVWHKLQEIDELREGDEERAGPEGVNPLTEQLRLRQEAEVLKAPGIADTAIEAVADGNSVAVFVNFTNTKEEIVARLEKAKIPFGVVEGGQNPTDRQQVIDDFQTDEVHVIVCMIQAGGVGISLHDTHGDRARLSLICPGWSATELIQALGRIHRAGAKTPATQQIITASGTVEDRIKYAVNCKVDNISALTDADLRTW